MNTSSKYYSQICQFTIVKLKINALESLKTRSSVGLDKLCFFFCLLFFLTILKKSAYYSSLVYPLFQFKDVTFILKRQFICGCIVALQKVKYNPLVLSFAFEKKSFPKGKVHTCLVASTNSTDLFGLAPVRTLIGFYRLRSIVTID